MQLVLTSLVLTALGRGSVAAGVYKSSILGRSLNTPELPT